MNLLDVHQGQSGKHQQVRSSVGCLAAAVPQTQTSPFKRWMPCRGSATSSKEFVDLLEENLKAYKHLSNESFTVTEALSEKLHDLTQVTGQIYTRATQLTVAQTNIAACKSATEQLYDCLQTTKKIHHRLEHGPGRDFDEFLLALTQLESAMEFLRGLQNLESARGAMIMAESTFTKAIAHCEADFTQTVTEHSNKHAPSISDLVDKLGDSATDGSAARIVLIPDTYLPRLSKLARTILRRGNAARVLERYVAVRQGVMDAVLKSCGHESLSPNGLQLLSPEQLEKKIQSWILQVRVLGVLVVSERQLTEEIWPKSHSFKVFAQIVGRHISLLFQQGRDLADTKRQPEKLYPLLDMHHHLKEVAPSLEAGLRNEVVEADDMITEVQQLLNFISTVARTILAEFEDLVAKDQTKKEVADGTVHSLCAYAISFLKKLFNYSNLEEVLFSKSQVTPAVASHLPAYAPMEQQAMAAALSRIMSKLLDNLMVKSKAYKNESLANLFLMNNIHYMAWSVEQYPPMFELLGAAWVEKHKDFVENYGSEYQRATWEPVLLLLQASDDPHSSPSRQSGNIKERMSQFNKTLEQIYSTQAAWTIPDPTLRKAVQRVIVQDILPRYEACYKRYQEVLVLSAKEPTKYLKYSPRDLQRMIEDLFETKLISLKKKMAREEY